jgi:hypothetical protein
MPHPLPVLLLLPPTGSRRAEAWMGEVRLAAALDLIERLQGIESVARVYALAARPQDAEALHAAGAEPWPAPPAPFHFGSVLAGFASGPGRDGLAYFGGASAPLASLATLRSAFAAVEEEPWTALVNNLYSTDWLVIKHAKALGRIAATMTTDNPLGWRLQQETGCIVRGQPPSAETRADLDTPADAFLASDHPNLGPHLAAALAQGPAELGWKVAGVRRVLQQPARTLAVIGRSSSQVWRLLEGRGQTSVRLFVEERGMLANGRVERGEVRSLVGAMIDDVGPEAFVARLSALADGALWDTRVWMAHAGAWPSEGDRFAADLGWPDEVEHPGLRRLAAAVAASPVPIVCGGHGVVAGAVLALLEGLAPTSP